MWLPQDGDRWMEDRHSDMPKIWLENLTEAQYEAYKTPQKLQKEKDRQRLTDRPEGF